MSVNMEAKIDREKQASEEQVTSLLLAFEQRAATNQAALEDMVLQREEIASERARTMEETWSHAWNVFVARSVTGPPYIFVMEPPCITGALSHGAAE